MSDQIGLIESLMKDVEIESKIVLLELLDKVDQDEAIENKVATSKQQEKQNDNVEKEELETKTQDKLEHELFSKDDELQCKITTCTTPEQHKDPEEAVEVPTKLRVNYGKTPKLISKFSLPSGNYFRGAKWSPDGTCILSNANDSKLRLFNPLDDFFDLEKVAKMTEELPLEPYLKIQEPETVYDFCWYPTMRCDEPASCCFAASSKDQPVHLWDSITGSLRASYIKYSDKQELRSPYSLAFSSDGAQLLCGYKKEVSIFFLDRPGSDCTSWLTFNKKQKQHRIQQNGIISSCVFSPDNTLFACTSYDGTLGLYDSTNGKPLLVSEVGKFGLTHVKFSQDGNRIYAGQRRDKLLACWDIRYLDAPLFEMSRHVSTNQRIYFDIMPHALDELESTVASGSTDGHVVFWQLDDKGDCDYYLESREMLKFQAHDDCTNGCDFNPIMPVLLTTSGQRVFPDYDEMGSDEEDDVELISCKRRRPQEDNSLKLWLLSLS